MRFYIKQLSIQLLILILIIFQSSCKKNAEPVNESSVTKTFPFQFYQSVLSNPTNLNLSPMAIKMAFSVLYQDAEGKNKSEFERTFGFPFTPKVIDSLSSSTAEWGKAPHSLKVAELTQWISTKTCNKISNISPELDPHVKSVIVSALCFERKWANSFDKEKTIFTHFQSSPYGTTNAAMMHKISSYLFYEDDRAEWLELSFEQSPIVLLLGLPKKRYELRPIELGLSDIYLQGVESGLKKETVDVVIPRFHFDQVVRLNDLAPQFTEAPSAVKTTTKMSKKSSANKMPEIFQALGLDVNENGVNVAEASHLDVKDERNFGWAKRFYANQPFIVVLKEAKTRELILLGRLYQP